LMFAMDGVTSGANDANADWYASCGVANFNGSLGTVPTRTSRQCK
jgi:hypothetical protein